ncbi:hypothetical protein BGZ90_009056 [Linnemannia elongata]|nr:hypothetical protein BGZ90_009056 [Linnemannia elongata]
MNSLHPFAIQELCDHLALFLTFQDCQALIQVSRLCYENFFPALWHCSNPGQVRRKGSNFHHGFPEFLTSGLEKHGHQVRNISIESWNGRRGISDLFRIHCRFLESIEVLEKGYCFDRAFLLRQLFFDGEKDKDKDAVEHREMDLSSLKRLSLAGLSSKGDDEVIRYLLGLESSFPQPSLLEEPSSSLTISVNNAMPLNGPRQSPRIPNLRKLSLTFGNPTSAREMTSLGLPELLNAFPSCRYWALQGVNLTKEAQYVSSYSSTGSHRSDQPQQQQHQQVQQMQNITLEDMDVMYARSLETLDLEFSRINIDCLTWILDRSPRMKDLTLSIVDYGDVPAFEFAQGSPQDMVGAPKSITVMIFETLTRSSQDLRTLQLLGSLEFQDDAKEAYTKFMATHPSLEELMICGTDPDRYLFESLIRPNDNGTAGDHKGLLRAAFLNCTIHESEPIHRWLRSPGSARLVVLDFRGTSLKIKEFFGKVGAGAGQDNGGWWACTGSLEVLKLTLEPFGPMSTATEENDEACAILDRARRFLESFVKLKALCIRGDGLPLSLIMESVPPVVDTPSPWSGSSSLLPPSFSPEQDQQDQGDCPSSPSPSSLPLPFQHLTGLQFESVYPRMTGPEAQQLLTRFPKLSRLIMDESLHRAGLEVLMNDRRRRERDPSASRLILTIS